VDPVTVNMLLYSAQAGSRVGIRLACAPGAGRAEAAPAKAEQSEAPPSPEPRVIRLNSSDFERRLTVKLGRGAAQVQSICCRSSLIVVRHDVQAPRRR
jgi:hypothetical protein